MGTRVVALDYDPVTKKLVPVTAEMLEEETGRWTVPPHGMPPWLHGPWRDERKRLLDLGMRPDEAWVRASMAMKKPKSR